MRCCTTLLSALLAGLVLAPASAGLPPAGRVSGEADAVYLLRGPSEAPAPQAAEAAGFHQTVRPRAGGWEISVSVSVRPGPAGPAKMLDADWARPAPSTLPPEFLDELRAALPPRACAEEAAASIARFLRARFAYEGRPGEADDPAAACRSGRASCVGLARIAAAALGAYGLSCQPVVGLRSPADGSALSLEGGALHVWLSVSVPGGNPFFLDPAFSSGWVPERYVVLRAGGGWSPGDLALYRGGVLEPLWRRDRLFYCPAGEGDNQIWCPGGPSSSTLTGKLVDGADAPLPGTAYLRGPDGVHALPLWQGNFCFSDLPAGDYELALESGGTRAGGESFSLAPMDKRSVVIYSRGERGRGAAHGTRRQPGGPLPP